MKNRNIPALITLCAGAIASIMCFVNNYPLLDTLWIVLVILLIFYIIGLIVGKIINKINQAANEAHVKAERERMKAEKADDKSIRPNETQEEDVMNNTNEIE